MDFDRHRPLRHTVFDDNPVNSLPASRAVRRSLLCLGLVALAVAGCSRDSGEVLRWESTNQIVTARMGEVTAKITFKVKNVSREPVLVQEVKASCGCTIAQLPSKPWKLAPKESGKFDVLVDLRGKFGELSKDIAVMTTNLTNVLMVTVKMPEGFTNGMSTNMADRLFGQQLAGMDRQAIFKNDCVSCHLIPAFGKTGEPLYQAACGICHEAKHRATMVPDLRTLTSEIDTNYWRQMIAHGKPGTLMPASAATEGGSLDDAQMDSLAEYLTKAFPRPVKKQPAPPAKATN
jgi:cytochrome c553